MSSKEGNATTIDDGCRCMDDGESMKVLSSLSTNPKCTTSIGDPGIYPIDSHPDCIPLTYGAECAPHDATDNPTYCQDVGASKCYRPWCYIADKERCMSSPTQRAYRSSYVAFERDGIDLYWSYTVCDGLDDWENSNVKQTLGGVTIVATTPQAYFPPYHYKRNVNTGEILSEPGEEYWNTSIPFEGAMIDYLDQLQQLADGDFDVQYTFGSKASKLVHPSSSYTAIVQDVKDGLIDMAVGPIWITGERLRLSSYTVPLFYSPTVLITSKPGVDSSLGAQTSKVLAPFEAGVWLLIVLIIALTAILSMWFSGEGPERLKIARRQSRSVVRSMARNIPEGPSMKKMKYKIWARLGLDACLRTGTFFFSAGIEQDMGASLPTKLLMFGFGAFVLVVVSAYVANLAAFLTKENYQYVGTMEEATKQGIKICALSATKEELEIAWPDTKFHFGASGAGSYHSLIDEWDNGRCKGIVYGFANLELLNMLCERDLVITKSVALENPVAWPIRPSYSAGLSYWMYEADKKYGLKVESIKEEYDAKTEQPSCNVYFSPEDSSTDDYAKISMANLFFPFIFFASFALMAFGLQLYVARQSERRKLGLRRPSLDSTLMGRNSTMFLNNSIARGIKEDPGLQNANNAVPQSYYANHLKPEEELPDETVKFARSRNVAQDSLVHWKENGNDSLSSGSDDDDEKDETEQNGKGNRSVVVTATPIGKGSWKNPI